MSSCCARPRTVGYRDKAGAAAGEWFDEAGAVVRECSGVAGAVIGECSGAARAITVSSDRRRARLARIVSATR